MMGMRTKMMASGVAGLFLFLILASAAAWAGDPTGASLGSAADITAKTPGQPTLEEVAAAVGHNKISINFVWVLVTGFLVMFMQAGFAMVETGFTRAKNVAHTMAMNFMVYPLGMLAFWVSGFALMYGGVGALASLGGENILNNPITLTLFDKPFTIMGWKGFFLSGDLYTPAMYTMFLFQMVFMDTTATIPTGAMAERWRFLPFCIYALIVGGLIYPIYGCWVWGGGWLAALGSNFGLGHGHVDFAGSSVVHLTGGVLALVGAKLIGARVGKYTKEGKPVAIPGHHIPMAVIGTFILCFGWFGFNPGSTLAGTDLRMGVVATNTMLAGAMGAFTSLAYVWIRYGKPDVSMVCNGMLAGLVAITAPCAYVNSISAVIIGGVSGVLVVWAVLFVERVLKIDDPVGAIAVHGFNGAWGILAVGLFADGTYGDGMNGVPGAITGLFFGGGASQLMAESIGILANLVFVGLAGYVMFKVINKITPLRSSVEDEIAGLDGPEIGVIGYPEFNLTHQAS